MFVIRYRIEGAKKKFMDVEFEKYKTEQIGQQVGFKSYQSFVQAFRIFENITPSKYRKELVNVAEEFFVGKEGMKFSV